MAFGRFMRRISGFLGLLLIIACNPNMYKLKPDMDKTQARRHYENGLSYLQKNQAELAFKEFYQAQQLDSNNALIYLGLGRTSKKLGKLELAADFLLEGIKNNSGLSDLYYHLGDVYTQKECWPEAIDNTLLALENKNFKKRAYALYNLGLCYMGLNSWEQAHDTFVAAILEKPDFILARWKLLLCLEHLGNWAEAIRNGRDILLFWKKHPYLVNKSLFWQVNKHINLAYSKLGKSQQSNSFIEKAQILFAY